MIINLPDHQAKLGNIYVIKDTLHFIETPYDFSVQAIRFK